MAWQTAFADIEGAGGRAWEGGPPGAASDLKIQRRDAMARLRRL